jgi:hypothetical protein
MSFFYVQGRQGFMPNSSGYPTKSDVDRWQADERASREFLEYQLPRDREKVAIYAMKRAVRECMVMCNTYNQKLNKSEIQIKATYACQCAQKETKALAFTNRYDDFEKLARPFYAKSYAIAQDIFGRNYRLLEQMCRHQELYGFDNAYGYIQHQIEYGCLWTGCDAERILLYG